jgi:hypothetical protein
MMGFGMPPPPPPRFNLDRFGMPRDYATYEWLLYGKRVEDKSPERLAALNRGAPSRPNPLRTMYR